jgi:hypothetical protein
MFTVEIPQSAFHECATTGCERNIFVSRRYCSIHAVSKVYVSLGDRYHASKKCSYLANVRNDHLMLLTDDMAWKSGYLPCRRCFK